MRLGVLLVEDHVVRPDHQPAAGAHRVARVGGEVDEHLVDLGGIGENPISRAARQHGEGLVGSEQALEHRDERGDRLMRVDELGLLDLAAAEGEELLCHARGPRGRAHHLAHVGGLRVALAERAEHELAEPQHRHELIVDFVRHPAGQRAHRLEPLRLAELLLGMHAVGDVGVRADPFPDLSLVVEHRHGPHLHAAVLAVAAAQAVLGGERPARGDGGAPGPERLVAIVGMDRLEPPAPGGLGSGLPGERLPLARVGGPAAVARRGPHDLRGGGDECAVAGLPRRSASSACFCSVTSLSTSMTAPGRPS